MERAVARSTARLFSAGIAIWVACLLLAPAALAQARDAAAAEEMFIAGRKAFESGDYETACARFRESQRLAPAPGTLINWAACEEKLGRLAAAWEKWRQAIQTLPVDDERRPSVQQRLDAVEPRVPKLQIELRAPTPDGTQITRDGVYLGIAARGVPLPVDPGRHRVVVTAPGHAPREYAVDCEEGRTLTLLVEPGARLHVSAPAEPPPAAVGDARRDAEQPESGGGGSTLKTVGFVTAGVGLAGLIVGTVTGVLALDRKTTIVDTCDQVGDSYYCGQNELDVASQGKSLATASTIAFTAGAILTGLGVSLVLFGDSKQRRSAKLSATVATDGASVTMRGTF